MNNDIYHYGVKGMRWGVRKAVEIHTDGVKREDEIAKKTMGLHPTQNRYANSGKDISDVVNSFKTKNGIKAHSNSVVSVDEITSTLDKNGGDIDKTVCEIQNSDGYRKAVDNLGKNIGVEGTEANDLYNSVINAFGGKEAVDKFVEKITSENIDAETLQEFAAGVDIEAILGDVEDEVGDIATDLAVNAVCNYIGVDEDTAKKLAEKLKEVRKTIKSAVKGRTDFVKGVYNKSIETTKGYIGKGKDFVDGITGFASDVGNFIKSTHNKTVERTKDGIANTVNWFKKKK